MYLVLRFFFPDGRDRFFKSESTLTISWYPWIWRDLIERFWLVPLGKATRSYKQTYNGISMHKCLFYMHIISDEGPKYSWPCPWYKTNIYLYNCMFACTIVLPYPKVPIKISRWDLSKSNSTKRSSKYSPIWKIYLGRLKK